MFNRDRLKFSHRNMLKSSAMLLAGGLVPQPFKKPEAEGAMKSVNLNSSPSTMKVTDMRYAVVVKPGRQPLRYYSNRYKPGCIRLGRGA